MDELAHAAGKDPVELRRMLLKSRPDWLLVLDTMVQKANWGKPLPKGSAQGVAIFESYGSVMGEIAEVSVSKKGEVRVEHVVCAVDCGHAVNPRTIEEQMESGVAYGLTALLYGQISVSETCKDTLYPCSDSAADSWCFGAQAVLTHSSIKQRHRVGTYRTMRFLSSRTCAHRTRALLQLDSVYQRDGAEHTSLVPQCWRHNVVVGLIEILYSSPSPGGRGQRSP